MKVLLSLLCLTAVMAKLNFPTAYSVKMTQVLFDGKLISTTEINTDGQAYSSKHYYVKDDNKIDLKSQTWFYKSNTTSYTISQGLGNGNDLCRAKANDQSLHDVFIFQWILQNATGPGAKCLGPAGQKAFLWSFTVDKQKGEVCVSDDGTTPYFMKITYMDEADVSMIDFVGGAPADGSLQSPAPCWIVDGQQMSMSKSYYAEYSAVNAAGTTAGKVVRLDNKDNSVTQNNDQIISVFVTRENSTFYKADLTAKTCYSTLAESNHEDYLGEFVNFASIWQHTTNKCSNGEGDIWIPTVSSSYQFCMKDAKIPLFLHTYGTNITWTNFRTTDLPAVTIPSICN